MIFFGSTACKQYCELKRTTFRQIKIQGNKWWVKCIEKRYGTHVCKCFASMQIYVCHFLALNSLGMYKKMRKMPHLLYVVCLILGSNSQINTTEWFSIPHFGRRSIQRIRVQSEKMDNSSLPRYSEFRQFTLFLAGMKSCALFPTESSFKFVWKLCYGAAVAACCLRFDFNWKNAEKFHVPLLHMFCNFKLQ